MCTVDGVVKYVGMGRKGREKHCLSGKSSCIELNRDFFTNKQLVVHQYFENCSKCEAEKKERELINAIGINNLYNRSKGITNKNLTPNTTHVLNFLDDLVKTTGNSISQLKLLNVIKKLSKKHNHPIKGLTSRHTLSKLMSKVGYSLENETYKLVDSNNLHSLKAEYILLLD